AVAHLECPCVVSDCPEILAQMAGDPTLTAHVAYTPGRVLGVPQVCEHLRHAPERPQGIAQVQVQVNEFARARRRVWKPIEDSERLVEALLCSWRRCRCEGSLSRPIQVPDGLLPDLAANSVMSQEIHALVRRVSVEPFDLP